MVLLSVYINESNPLVYAKQIIIQILEESLVLILIVDFTNTSTLHHFLLPTFCNLFGFRKIYLHVSITIEFRYRICFVSFSFSNKNLFHALCALGVDIQKERHLKMIIIIANVVKSQSIRGNQIFILLYHKTSDLKWLFSISIILLKRLNVKKSRIVEHLISFLKKKTPIFLPQCYPHLLYLWRIYLK